MEHFEIISSEYGETQETKLTIKINDLDYLYEIFKLDKDEGIKIKLSEVNPKTNIYYEYEASKIKLKENIQILLYCESLDEMISIIKTIFDEGKVKFIEENNKYYIELQFEIMGKSKKNRIELIKYEPKDPLYEINDKINKMQNDIKNINKEIEELKNKETKNNIKEILEDKNLKMKLYEEFEQIICSKFNMKEKEEDELFNIINKEKSMNRKEEGKENNKKREYIEEQIKLDNEKILKEFNTKYKLNIDINITKLDLENKKIGNEGLKDLIKIDFKELKELYLNDNDISDITVLEKVKFEKLEILGLNGNKIDKIKTKLLISKLQSKLETLTI